MKAKEYSINMCEGPLFPKIITFTIPLILSSILQLLFNAADMIVAGKYVGKEALAAIGTTASLINLIINVFMGLSVGSNVLVARYRGAKREQDVSETVHTSVLLALICGLILAFIGVVFAPKILVLMGTPENVLPLSSLYIRIYFLGMPMSMLYNFGAAILRAVGDTKHPLTYLTIAGALNAVCNVIFIVVFHMGVDGVAYATILSQAVSAILTLGCLIKSRENYRLEFKKLRLHKDKVFQIMRLGLPAGFQGAIFSMSNVLIQSSINSFGESAMAGNTAAVNLEGFVYTSMNSFYHACLSFTSQNYGAHKFDRVKKVLYTCLGCVCVTGAVLGFLAWFFGPRLLSIYASGTDKDIVIQYGMLRIPIIMLSYFLCGAMDVIVGSIRGLGYSVMPMIVSLLGACGFRILWIFTVFKKIYTLPCLYYSYPISWALTFSVHLICFVIVFKKMKKNNQSF